MVYPGAARRGEELRRGLIEEGVLDLSLKVRREGAFLIFPVTEWRKGAVRDDFEPRPQRPDLPRHELIGGIAIMQEKDTGGAKKSSRPAHPFIRFSVLPVLFPANSAPVNLPCSPAFRPQGRM